ncbi:MFS transporter [Streptosporangium fragile]|uniref:MFS transporter n=1 Tax=Streptosporangium fragile TaxID=46186 RepID=A0ABN3WCM5_9ACTN
MEAAHSAAQEKPSLWHNKDFMFLWSGQTVSNFGSVVTQLAIPLAAVELVKASTLQIGILSAIATLPFLLVSLPAGAIVDRMTKHKLMMWCDIGRMVLVGSIPLVTFPGLGLHVTYVHLLVVALLSGILTVFFDVSSQSYLPVLLNKDELIDGNSKLGTTASVAHFAGPSIGGALIGLLGAARAIAIDAFSYAVSALSLALIRKPEPAPEPRAEGRKLRHEIAEGLNFVLKHPILRKVIAATATSNFSSSIFTAMSMVFLVRILHVEPGYVGLIWSLSAIGGMIGGILAGRLSKRFGSARIIWIAPLILGFPMLLQPLAQPGWGVLLYAAGYFFFSLYAIVYNVAAISYRQAITPPEMLGRMTASFRFIVWGTLPIGAAIGGVLGAQLGVRETIWIGVIGTWLSGVWVLFSPLRKMRDFSAWSEDEDGEPAQAEPAR